MSSRGFLLVFIDFVDCSTAAMFVSERSIKRMMGLPFCSVLKTAAQVKTPCKSVWDLAGAILCCSRCSACGFGVWNRWARETSSCSWCLVTGGGCLSSGRSVAAATAYSTAYGILAQVARDVSYLRSRLAPRKGAGLYHAAHVVPSVHTSTPALLPIGVPSSFGALATIAAGNPAGGDRLSVLGVRRGGDVSTGYAAQPREYEQKVAERAHDGVVDVGVAGVLDAARCDARGRRC